MAPRITALYDRLFVPQVELVCPLKIPLHIQETTSARASRGQTNAACPGKHTTRINNSYLKKAAGGRAGQGPRGRGALDAKDADWTTDDGHPIQDRPC